MDYKIEKNIPIKKLFGGWDEKYPFSKMEIGDSFTVTGEEKFIVRSAAYAHANRHNKKFKTRAEDENTTRVWRVK